MPERWSPIDRFTPKERELPEELYDVMSRLNKTAMTEVPELSIADFNMPDSIREKDAEYVRKLMERRREFTLEKSEYAAFLETVLPETQAADWFGDEVHINRYRGEIDVYNDQRGADYILELESSDPKRIPVLRVDVTKTNSREQIFDEKIGAVERSMERGHFADVYFASQAHEEVMQKVHHAPGIVWHLNPDQIIDLGKSVGTVLKREKGSNQALAEHPLQLLLIDQAKSQLENQALYIIGLLFQEIDRQNVATRLPAERRLKLVALYDRAVKAVHDGAQDVLTILKDTLTEDLRSLPRASETVELLSDIEPWLSHFKNLQQKKMSSLSENIQKRAHEQSGLNPIHEELVARSPHLDQIFPGRLAA